MTVRRLAIASSLLSACVMRTALPPAQPEPGVPSDALPPTNRETGEVLEAVVPGLDGQPLALADLRGRVVVLELTATWVADWDGNAGAYDALLDESPEHTAVVVVGMDPDRAALEARWSEPPRLGLWRGWDPQGGLAAQLQVAKLPTVIVLDASGVIRGVWGGYQVAQWPEVVRVIEEARGPGPAPAAAAASRGGLPPSPTRVAARWRARSG